MTAEADSAVRVEGLNSQPVVVGRGLTETLGERLPEDAQRLFVVFQPSVQTRVDAMVDALRAEGREVRLFAAPDGRRPRRLTRQRWRGSGWGRRGSPDRTWWWPWAGARSRTWRGS
ncbi:MAG: hypothetical protein LBT54_05110 [Bifidobacteriaceae bacterium]|nr:hypothetical protein [Bifidobacteriaceae bacterium]